MESRLRDLGVHVHRRHGVIHTRPVQHVLGGQSVVRAPLLRDAPDGLQRVLRADLSGGDALCESAHRVPARPSRYAELHHPALQRVIQRLLRCGELPVQFPDARVRARQLGLHLLAGHLRLSAAVEIAVTKLRSEEGFFVQRFVFLLPAVELLRVCRLGRDAAVLALLGEQRSELLRLQIGAGVGVSPEPTEYSVADVELDLLSRAHHLLDGAGCRVLFAQCDVSLALVAQSLPCKGGTALQLGALLQLGSDGLGLGLCRQRVHIARLVAVDRPLERCGAVALVLQPGAVLQDLGAALLRIREKLPQLLHHQSVVLAGLAELRLLRPQIIRAPLPQLRVLPRFSLLERPGFSGFSARPERGFPLVLGIQLG